MNRATSIECAIAITPEERKQVYRLRYECYRRTGAIVDRDDQQFSDAFDRLPNSFSIFAHNSDNAVASVRVGVVRRDLGWTDSPVQHVYGDESSLHSIARESFVEASRLCFGAQARRDAFVRLTGYMAAIGEFYRVGWLVACPRVEHAHSYQRMFGFRVLAAPRQYFGVNFQTQLLGVRMDEIAEYVRGQRPMLQAWSDAREFLNRSGVLPSPHAAIAA